MGAKISLFDAASYQVVLLGLDNAGKSTIIYRLKTEHFVQQGPTVGFNCEKFRPSNGAAKGQSFTVWDVGGQEKLRPLWRTYVRQTDAIVFVVDSTDEERFDECRIELLNLLQMSDLPPAVPIVFLANKQDLPEAKAQEEIDKAFGSAHRTHPVQWFSCCAVTGEGLDDLFSTLHSLILQSRKTSKKK